jgi:hypothetical protein
MDLDVAFLLSASGLVLSQVNMTTPILLWIACCDWCQQLRHGVGALFGGAS